jgi:Dolichyl-phosphate-mannose-protein mannosyltransferase
MPEQENSGTGVGPGLDLAPPPASESLAKGADTASAAVPLGARLAAWWTSFSAGDIDVQELAIVVSLLALCVLVRVLWLTPVDVFTDAGVKWHFARQLAYGNDFPVWNHHMARLGINLPVFLLQRVLGTYPTVYYVAPVAAFTLQILFIYWVARRLSGRAAGVIAGLLLIFNTGMIRSGSQLLPDGFGGTVAVIIAYCLIRFEEEEGRKRLYWLIGSGVACFYAYWVKESNVLLWPGVVISVWLSKRSFREAFLVVGVMLSFVAIETACFRLFTPYAHRLAIVQDVEDWYPPITFMRLFDRFTKLELAWQLLFWMWIPSMLWVAGSKDKRVRPVVLLGLSFMFLLTFMVRSINPIVQWTAFKSRYIAVAAPFFVICIGMFTVDAVRRIWAAYAQPGWQVAAAHLARRGPVWAVGVCLGLGALTYRQERGSFSDHPLVTLRRDSAILNDAFRRNLPIVEDAAGIPHGLNTIYAIYLNDQYLAQSDVARPGHLPDIDEGVRHSHQPKKLAYVLRDAGAYHTGELAQMLESGCAITVRGNNAVVVDSPNKLPESCKAPRGSAIPR